MADTKQALPSTPINHAAEQALLGSIMMDANAANEYVSQLSEKDFAMSQNTAVFKAVAELNQENMPIDALTVADRLRLHNKLSDAGGMEYLSGLFTCIPSSANVQQYFDIVKRDSLRRDIINAGNEIVKHTYTGESGQEALDFAERTVFEISEAHESTKLRQIVDAATQAYNRVKSVQMGEYVETGIESGYKNLDDIISVFPNGALCMIAARPSVGKTAFSLSIAVNAAIRRGKTTAIFSLEMPAVQLVQRMLTALSGVSFSKQNRRGAMDINDSGKMFRAHEALANSNIYVDDNSYNTPSDIISKCRRLKNTVGLDLVIIDYLQLMTLGEKKENRQQEVSDMSRKMKNFAKELNVPFIVLSQMSRAAEQRGDEPMLSDLRESGAIEQDADIVIFLHRPKKVDSPKTDEANFVNNYEYGSLIKLIVAKNRNGGIGNTYFGWNADKMIYTPIAFEKGETPPAIKINTEVTDLEKLNKSMSDDPFDDLVAANDSRRRTDVGNNDAEFVETDGNAALYSEDTADENQSDAEGNLNY